MRLYIAVLVIFAALQWALVPFALLGSPLWSPFTYFQPASILLGVWLAWRLMKGRDFWDLWDLGWLAKVIILGLVFAGLTGATNLCAVNTAHPWAFARRARAACVDDLQNATSMSDLPQSGPRGYYAQSFLVSFEEGEWILILQRSLSANGWVRGYYCQTLDSAGVSLERWSHRGIELPPIQETKDTFLATTTTATLRLFRYQLERRGFEEVALPAEILRFEPGIR